MTHKYRSKSLVVGPDSGSYVTVFQRPGESPQLDLSFFDGDRSLEESFRLERLLTKALCLARKWAEES